MDGDRHVVLLGRPGADRTHVGRRLARLLQRPFADADEQLELAAGSTLSRLAHEGGEDDLHRREAQVLAGLLAQDVALVILAPGAVALDPRNQALLARSAVVVWPRGPDDARAQPDRVSDHYEGIADHIVDLEPFRAADDRHGRAVARHILELLVTGELRGLVHVPDRALARADGRLCEDAPEVVIPLEQELPADVAGIADQIVDVEPFHATEDQPERAIALYIARLLARDEARPADPP